LFKEGRDRASLFFCIFVKKDYDRFSKKNGSFNFK